MNNNAHNLLHFLCVSHALCVVVQLKGAGLKKPRVVDVAADAEAPPFKKPAATNVGPREPLGQLTNTPKGCSYSPLRLQG